ncbi:hypothetical protein SO802_027289 [Lithocarpus litseifolius]|uniref:DUF4283 domain-containing protein n=1 Tax=Lithocarpus litseifolius TaxID=425828 RepID=A0AAW2C255_9ROSI
MWSRFSLSEEEEFGAEVSKQNDKEIHRLAGRFFTKRVMNMEAIGRTFKPLRKLIGELKIRDLGDNILVFDFEDGLDLERVLDLEPWMYDKHMVVFERATEIEAIPMLEFNKATFSVQIHNVPEKSLTQATGEAVGSTIGRVIEVADPEDDGSGNEFLRVRVAMDISKPLPQCRKLWSEGKQVGWWALDTNASLIFVSSAAESHIGKGIVNYGFGVKPGSKADSSQSQSEEVSGKSMKAVGSGKDASNETMLRDIGGSNLNFEGSSAETVPSMPKNVRQSFNATKVCAHVASPPTIPLGD